MAKIVNFFVVKKGWFMYEVSDNTLDQKYPRTFCLYKQQKCGCADSIALYVNCNNESEAADIFLKHIPLLPKGKKINMGGILMTPKNL